MSVDTLLSNAERYSGFFDKTGSMIKDIAGGTFLIMKISGRL